MEFFLRAKVFRLKSSHQSKYLLADQDEETVKLTREISFQNTRWSYELVEGKTNVIRLRSCQSWKYLAASEEHYLLGMTGKRVAQRPWLGPTVEWEPIQEGPYIKLKSHTGTFLRANKGLPPWRNTITHDLAGHWTASESMILWIVDIVEIDLKSTNGDSKFKERDISGNGVPSLLSNVVDQKSLSLSSTSSLSTGDDGSAVNVPSSIEHSASFSQLKSMLAGLDDVIDEVDSQGETSDTEGVLPLKLKMAKQTLEELMDMDFDAIMSLGRYKELENAVNMLVADARTSLQKTISYDLTNLQEQLKAMKIEHDSATKDLVEYATFANQRMEIKAELEKEVAKACVLEGDLEIWFSNEFVDESDKTDELLKQLEETENSIKAVEVLKTRIEKKSKRLEEMELEEELLQARKVKAEKRLDKVKKEWGKAKSSFQKVLYI